MKAGLQKYFISAFNNLTANCVTTQFISISMHLMYIHVHNCNKSLQFRNTVASFHMWWQ